MILILSLILLIFGSYYLASLSITNSRKRMVYLGCFLLSSCYLRLLLDANLNNDYYYYFDFQIFHKPTSFLSFWLNEPYLYGVYAFFSLLFEAKKDVFLGMYWFNFVITTIFFIWLLYRKDVEMWKKMFLFVLHYFLFAFVVLRNGPAYMLFAMYFYYTFRDRKFNWVLLTPLMHISSSLVLINYFHKWKYYFKMLLAAILFIGIFAFISKPLLTSIDAFKSILSKIDIYSRGMPEIGLLHILFFIFIFGLLGAGFVIYKRQLLHPIIITTALFYGITFFINPIVAHRFSPYIIFALLLFPVDTTIIGKKIFLLNRLTILLLPLFLYSLFNAHRTESFRQLFFK